MLGVSRSKDYLYLAVVIDSATDCDPAALVSQLQIAPPLPDYGYQSPALEFPDRSAAVQWLVTRGFEVVSCECLADDQKGVYSRLIFRCSRNVARRVAHEIIAVQLRIADRTPLIDAV